MPWNKNTRQNLTKVIKCVHLAIIQWYFNVNEVKSIIIFKPKMLSIFFILIGVLCGEYQCYKYH